MEVTAIPSVTFVQNTNHGVLKVEILFDDPNDILQLLGKLLHFENKVGGIIDRITSFETAPEDRVCLQVHNILQQQIRTIILFKHTENRSVSL